MKNYCYIIFSLTLLLAVVLFAAPNSFAQDDDVTLEHSQPLSEKMPSLFFTYWQHEAIQDAKNSRGVVRPPTQEELDAINQGEDFRPDPGIRDITLGGIVYVKNGDWTIWLNGQRVTPDAVPEEVLDLRVHKNHIEVKWLDDYTDQVFPIRLRAHERFNLDTRMFLPR